MARKTSTRGKASWSELEGLRKRSGQSIAAFCRERGINPAGLYAWRRHPQIEKIQQSSHSLGDFLPVKVVDAVRVADCVLEVELRNGRRLRFHGEFTPGRLADILKALEASSC